MKRHSVKETPRTTGLTVRLPAELADVLRNYAFLTNTSANDVIKRALIDYLKTHSRAEMMDAACDRVLHDHGVALDKLKDM
jgi:predicted transcriptional regulator